MCSARSEWVSCRSDITKNVPLDNCTQITQGSSLQVMTQTLQLISGHQQLQQMQRQVLVQGQGKLNPFQPGQLFNTAVGPPIRPSTAQSTNPSSISSMGVQITAPGGGAQNQGGVMSVPMNAAVVNSVTSGSVLLQSASSMQIRRPSQEEVMAAKRCVDEQKKMAFSRG